MEPARDQGRAVRSLDVPSAARLAAAILAVWIGLGVVMGVQFYVNGTFTGGSIDLWGIELSVRRYLIYAVLTFPVLWLCRRFPPSVHVLPTLAAHAGGSQGLIIRWSEVRVLLGAFSKSVLHLHWPSPS